MKETAEFINNGNNFAIISHISPDGDTMGSAAALLYALKKLGKNGKWFCEGEVPKDFMKIDEIASLVSESEIDSFDSVICVDISSSDRMGNCIELFKRIPRKAQIDHHITNTLFADTNLVREHSAASFIILELLNFMGIKLDEHIARALFVGVSTDTGRLSHADVTADEVALTAQLYKYSINQNELIDTLFRTTTLTKTRINGRAAQHIQTALDGRVTYSYLEYDDYAELEATGSDSENVIEMCRSVEGTRIAFFLRQVHNGFKVSMRCTTDYDVSTICESFGGGGHKLAAGCTIEGSLWDVIMQILRKIEEII